MGARGGADRRTASRSPLADTDDDVEPYSPRHTVNNVVVIGNVPPGASVSVNQVVNINDW